MGKKEVPPSDDNYFRSQTSTFEFENMNMLIIVNSILQNMYKIIQQQSNDLLPDDDRITVETLLTKLFVHDDIKHFHIFCLLNTEY